LPSEDWWTPARVNQICSRGFIHACCFYTFRLAGTIIVAT
jgi:hypothetical protein